MTEAKNSTYMPQLVYLSSYQEPVTEVSALIADRFGVVTEEQITWINKEKSTFTIEMVRELIQSMSYASLKGKVRHVILVGIDQAGTEAQNALLKLLEEPPAITQIWLTAEHSQKILPTVISRCNEIFLNNGVTDHESPAEIAQLGERLPHTSHRELSDLAGTYSEREDAKKLVEQLNLFFHKELESSLQPGYGVCVKILLQTALYLDANVNVRLALENCFFSLKRELNSKS